jgi:hypothetical protein
MCPSAGCDGSNCDACLPATVMPEPKPVFMTAPSAVEASVPMVKDMVNKVMRLANQPGDIQTHIYKRRWNGQPIP